MVVSAGMAQGEGGGVIDMEAAVRQWEERVAHAPPGSVAVGVRCCPLHVRDYGRRRCADFTAQIEAVGVVALTLRAHGLDGSVVARRMVPGLPLADAARAAGTRW